VRENGRETADTFTLVLDPGGEPFAFAPGQFNMLYAFGEGEAPISISGDPAEPRRLVHTVRAVGNVTRALERLRRGDAVGVRGPFGRPWPVEAAKGHDVVILAGGIGLAPLRPAIHHVLAHRAQYGRVVVLYGARTPADLLYPRQLQEWRGRFDVEVEVTVDRSGADWQGSVGVVTRLLPRAPFEPSRAMAFVCGPELMMRFAVAELVRRGMDADRVFVSLERNMKCGTRHCGHCQLGPFFVCHDGPVFPHAMVAPFLAIREA
jgi:NAD(P)H-flavin reductase